MRTLKKTRIKSYRFDSDFIERIVKAARREYKTENNFVNNIIEERLIIDPLIPAFQEIRLSSETFQAIVSATNIDVLEAAASEMAQKSLPLIRELYESNDHAITFEEFVTTILGRYGRWFYIEGNTNWSQGRVTLRHAYGMKWSRFLRAYLLSAYAVFSKERIGVKLGDRFVRINLSK